MIFPDYLLVYREAASLLCDQVGELLFAGTTYQIHVAGEWVFLQLSLSGELEDGFCSCQVSDERGGCPHLAAAFLKVWEGKEPFHSRFEASLWNGLAREFCRIVGDDPDALEWVERGHWRYLSASSELLFSVKATNRKAAAHLEELLFEREEETEETSIKFSSLPMDELIRWRRGEASAKMRYLLSFWFDLAKWLLELQSRGYQLRFIPEGALPEALAVTFSDLELFFFLSRETLAALVPALETVDAPLTVQRAFLEEIEEIRYLPEERELVIMRKEVKGLPRGGERVGQWLFFPGKGFYLTGEGSLLGKERLAGRQIADLFSSDLQLVQERLKGAALDPLPRPVSYTLFFDKEWDLHLVPYLFQEGDLERGHLFFPWVYLEESGFFLLEGLLFEVLEKVVPKEEVGAFVTHHRAWLNGRKGFETHVGGMETQVGYQVGEDGALTFSRQEELGESSCDFGPWIYVEGEGFYPKRSAPVKLPIGPGFAIKADQIPLFIRQNVEELKHIPRFFSKHSPVVNTGLVIEVTERGSIAITPHYELLPTYREKVVHFFDPFAYVAGEGFSELPPSQRLPERFCHFLEIAPKQVPFFLRYELPELEGKIRHLDPRLTVPEELLLTVSRLEKKGGDYRLHLALKTELGELSFSALWEGWQQDRRYFFSPVGYLDFTEKRFRWLKLIRKEAVQESCVTLSAIELLRLHALTLLKVEEGKKVLEELIALQSPKLPPLTDLKSTLRHYQQVGVEWLFFLYSHGLSGLLCDEMGLGKTHQAMALMAAIRSQKKEGRFLVICPTSVVYHWQEKIAQYLPGYRVCLFHGAGRSLSDFKQGDQVLLTTYGVWRLEHTFLSRIAFELAVFDEIQAAKNQATRLHSSLRDLQAKMRLGMTGTPIENHLGELKALFDLVLPGYMPSDAEYRRDYLKPIEKAKDEERRSQLSRLIYPFILRRRKNEVLTDLPDKIEEIAHCSLSEEQRQLYSDLLFRMRQSLIPIEDTTQPISYVHIFSILSGLKQICGHPAAYLKEPLEWRSYSSGKWDLFVELLSEALESEQKVVVFSQYLSMLDIMQDYLKEIGVSYATIRGSTTDRGKQVRRFQEDPDCQVFLGSLQAAGVGVDLTAASVVIHYDRWWNPAKENQATDRVHRIGQKRGVQVFKLVTLGTFEERIDAIITKKKGLLDEVVGFDDQAALKRLSREELLFLLEPFS